MIIREVEKPRFWDIFGVSNRHPFAPAGARSDPFQTLQLVGSGKGAITLILKYLAEKGIIQNKLDEILVPDWLGSWVYSQMNPFIFPSKRFSERTKIIFVYHQYGFPQDMDAILAFAREKNLVVIEDCAHALESYYKNQKNQRAGFMGDYSVFSFSKWFFCFALGGVRGENADFADFVKKELSKVPFGITFLKDFAKWLYETSIFSRSAKLRAFSNALLDMSYATYGIALKPSHSAQKLFEAKRNFEIMVRQRRYREFREATDYLGICSHLEKNGVTPYIIPIRVAASKTESIIQALRKTGVETDVYHFDINRNMLSPQFVPCIWVPCHGGITDEGFKAIIKLICLAYAE